MFNLINDKWQEIINYPSLKDGLKKSHVSCVPYALKNNVLQIFIEEEKVVESYKKWNLDELSKVVHAVTDISVKCEYTYLRKKYDIPSNYLEECIDFSLNSLNNMTRRDFQNKDIEIRSNEDYVIDTIRGKLAEYIFRDFLYFSIGYKVEIDNEIYESTILTDNGNDIQVIYDNFDNKYLCNLKVDIKGSKGNSQWLLVEETKAISDIYIFVKIHFVNEKFLGKGLIDEVKLKNNKEYKNMLSRKLRELLKDNYHGEIAGYAYMTDIIDPISKRPWFLYKEKQSLLKVHEVEQVIMQSQDDLSNLISQYNDVLEMYKVDLKAEKNWGVPAKYLRQSPREWLKLFNLINVSLIKWEDQIFPSRFKFLNNRTESEIENRKKLVYSNLQERRNYKGKNNS